jgi:hypothetical protein
MESPGNSRSKAALPALAACLIAALSATATASVAELPIFDAHIHYSRDAWSAFDPSEIIVRLTAAGVRRALVSSTPDDGTLRLHGVAPRRFVPALRPYREPGDGADWLEREDIVAYIEARLDRAPYRAIGEFHLQTGEQARTPEMRRIAELAAERGIHLHVHADSGPVEALLAERPGLKILWAHAGMSAPPETIGAVLDRHALVAAELSFRAGDILRGGVIDAAWRDLLIRHADRFVIGTDTYVTSRWDDYPALIAEHRRWLAELPDDVAEAIAWRNAARLLGVDGAANETGVPARPPTPPKAQ